MSRGYKYSGDSLPVRCAVVRETLYSRNHQIRINLMDVAGLDWVLTVILPSVLTRGHLCPADSRLWVYLYPRLHDGPGK